MPSRSYEQLCALARALELVGDRWTILLLRHLTHGPRRYGELQALLSGISPALLSDRLRRMVEDGLVTEVDDAGYALTEYGRGAEPAMWELMRWGATLLGDPERADETAHADWVVFPVRWLLSRHPVAAPLLLRVEAPPRAPVVLELRPEDAQLVATDDAGTGTGGARDATEPDAVLRASSVRALAAVLSGRLDADEAFAAGDVEITGDDGWFSEALRVAHDTPSTAVLAGRTSPAR